MQTRWARKSVRRDKEQSTRRLRATAARPLPPATADARPATFGAPLGLHCIPINFSRERRMRTATLLSALLLLGAAAAARDRSVLALSLLCCCPTCLAYSLHNACYKALRKTFACRRLLAEDAGGAIMGGRATQKDRFPYAVNIRSSNEPGREHQFCGGSLIAPRLVLTAARKGCSALGWRGVRPLLRSVPLAQAHAGGHLHSAPYLLPRAHNHPLQTACTIRVPGAS